MHFFLLLARLMFLPLRLQVKDIFKFIFQNLSMSITEINIMLI